jgi:sulfur-oxidizing protein SoxX
VADEAIPEPLTSTPGDANRGRALVLDRSNGKCVTCQQLPLPADFLCDIGPPLAELAERYTIEQLRLRIFDSKRINPESNMPSYHRVDGLTAVRRDWVGRPMLTAQEVEDLLAYLMTLR